MTLTGEVPKERWEIGKDGQTAVPPHLRPLGDCGSAATAQLQTASAAVPHAARDTSPPARCLNLQWNYEKKTKEVEMEQK